MKTIARNFNPIGGSSSSSLDARPGRDESLRKTIELRARLGVRRADASCVHGNAVYIDFTHVDALRDRSSHAPRLFAIWTGGKCICDRTMTSNPFLLIPAEDWMDEARWHDKGRCGGCTEHCGGFEGRTIDEWMRELGVSIEDVLPTRHPLFARVPSGRSRGEHFDALRKLFPGFAEYALEHAIARR